MRSYFHKSQTGRPTARNIRSWSPARWQRTSSSPRHLSARSTRGDHIEVRALEDGYLEPITIKEGQAVKEGDVLFEIVPVLYKARWDAEVAERDLAQLELNNTQKLADKKASLRMR